MSELSDKYKAALESLEISPDFKERTAEMMKKLRDSEENPPVQIAAEDDVTENVTALISENENRSSRIAFYRIASAAAAAAACFVIGVSVNRAGVFDSISTSESTAEAMLDTIDESYVTAAAEEFPETQMTEAAPAEDMEMPYESQETAVISGEAVSGVTAAETVYSQATPINTDNDGGSGDADTAAAENADKMSSGTVKKESKIIAVDPPMETGNRETAFEYMEEDSPEAEAAEELPPLYEAQYDPPAAGRATDEEPDEAAPEDNETAAVSQISKATDFTAESCISRFRPYDSEAVITPLSGSFPEEVVPARISGRAEIRSFEDDLIALTSEHEAQLITSVPTDSRYIVDFSDSRGNTMRIYIGVSRYICYSSQGSMFSFELTEEEYAELDEYFITLLS